MFGNPILIAGGVALALLGGVAWVQTQRLETSKAELAVAEGQLVSCGGRLQNLIEDVRSDNEIDRLSDDALRSVPSEWLRIDPAD